MTSMLATPAENLHLSVDEDAGVIEKYDAGLSSLKEGTDPTAASVAYVVPMPPGVFVNDNDSYFEEDEEPSKTSSELKDSPDKENDDPLPIASVVSIAVPITVYGENRPGSPTGIEIGGGVPPGSPDNSTSNGGGALGYHADEEDAPLLPPSSMENGRLQRTDEDRAPSEGRRPQREEPLFPNRPLTLSAALVAGAIYGAGMGVAVGCAAGAAVFGVGALPGAIIGTIIGVVIGVVIGACYYKSCTQDPRRQQPSFYNTAVPQYDSAGSSTSGNEFSRDTHLHYE